MCGGSGGWGWTDKILLTCSHTQQKKQAAVLLAHVCVCVCRIIFLLSWPLQKRYWTCPLKPVKQSYKTLQWLEFSFLSASQTFCRHIAFKAKSLNFNIPFNWLFNCLCCVSSTEKKILCTFVRQINEGGFYFSSHLTKPLHIFTSDITDNINHLSDFKQRREEKRREEKRREKRRERREEKRRDETRREEKRREEKRREEKRKRTRREEKRREEKRRDEREDRRDIESKKTRSQEIRRDLMKLRSLRWNLRWSMREDTKAENRLGWGEKKNKYRKQKNRWSETRKWDKRCI